MPGCPSGDRQNDLRSRNRHPEKRAQAAYDRESTEQSAGCDQRGRNEVGEG